VDDTVALPAGTSATYTITAAVARDASGTLAHTATVADLGAAELDPANNTATGTLQVRPAPADPPATPAPVAPSPAPETPGGGRVAVCTSRRVFPLGLSAIYPAGRARVLSADVTRTNGRRIRRLRTTRNRATVDLRGLTRGTYVLRVRVRLASGATRTIIRRYRTCQARR
jgi:hypothetical protein